MKRSITILPGVRRQLSSCTTAEFPTKQRSRTVQSHNTDSEDCVDCFQHPCLLLISSFVDAASPHISRQSRNETHSYSSSSSSPLLLNMLSDQRLCSKLM